jgi:protein tyrosine phosphatase (PTP) superfamily phosphohydrolase (DUF442 family)
VGPGITRFVAVDLKLAGGSVPAGPGLKWLVEKGYRTVLDLRESSEVPSSFIAEVTNQGLRYVPLPIGLKSIDRDHLARFNFEIAAGEARPLFFFDSDGTRAGALWYIRRITKDRVDRQIAKREAEELGLSDPSYWSAVTNFVAATASVQRGASFVCAQQEPGRPQALLAETAPASGPDRASTAPQNLIAAKAPDSHDPATNAGAVSASQPPVTPEPTALQSTASSAPTVIPNPAPADPPAPAAPIEWRPYAAMVITGLSFPLAYWSRTFVPFALAKARASLPAPVHRPKSLRGELGA